MHLPGIRALVLIRRPEGEAVGRIDRGVAEIADPAVGAGGGAGLRRHGASIVPVGSVAIRSVTSIDQHSVEDDSSNVMPIESAVLMSTDGTNCGEPLVPARALPHSIRLSAPEWIWYSSATTGTVEPATRPGRVAVR
jgi:hypothetical protein